MPQKRIQNDPLDLMAPLPWTDLIPVTLDKFAQLDAIQRPGIN